MKNNSQRKRVRDAPSLLNLDFLFYIFKPMFTALPRCEMTDCCRGCKRPVYHIADPVCASKLEAFFVFFPRSLPTSLLPSSLLHILLLRRADNITRPTVSWQPSAELWTTCCSRLMHEGDASLPPTQKKKKSADLERFCVEAAVSGAPA